MPPAWYVFAEMILTCCPCCSRHCGWRLMLVKQCESTVAAAPPAGEHMHYFTLSQVVQVCYIRMQEWKQQTTYCFTGRGWHINRHYFV